MDISTESGIGELRRAINLTCLGPAEVDLIEHGGEKIIVVTLTCHPDERAARLASWQDFLAGADFTAGARDAEDLYLWLHLGAGPREVLRSW